ncbi:hypothetical protein [Streptomyces sp. NPDC057552]|uniref:hypothetical protein n=1 Tax=Streptomyces sp. NPDC057552 TaxID=3350537 RepID=UPI0036B89EB7
MTSLRLLANGASTDHPVPGLPFADDIHLGGGPYPSGLARIADPETDGLVWIVHAHPGLGRTVALYEAGPDFGPWEWHSTRPLVTRAGGYWWDGVGWHRPPQLWDETAGFFEDQPVPAATTITAADLLDGKGDADRGDVHRASTLTRKSAAVDTSQWRHDLSRWSRTRTPAAGHLPLERCVVSLTAPELAGEQLLGTRALAAAAGISSSALRAYISRGQGAVPPPQTVLGNRPMWSRPVAENWAEHRRRPATDRWPSHRDRPALPPGTDQIRRTIGPVLFAALWDDPERRARWALRHRTRQAVGDVAADLAYLAADRLQETCPTQALADVLTQAALADPTAAADGSSSVGQVLDWFARHHAPAAETVVSAITEQLRQGIPRAHTVQPLPSDALETPAPPVSSRVSA